jgi:hypothetical protein
LTSTFFKLIGSLEKVSQRQADEACQIREPEEIDQELVRVGEKPGS